MSRHIINSHMHISLVLNNFTIRNLFSSDKALKNLLFFFAVLMSASLLASWVSSFRYFSTASASQKSVSVSLFSLWLTSFIMLSLWFLREMYLNLFMQTKCINISKIIYLFVGLNKKEVTKKI